MIDAHAHLSASSLAPIVDDVVPQLRAAGVRHIILGGVDPADWGRQLAIARRYPGFLTTCAGIHPWIVRDCEPHVLDDMFHQLRDSAANFDLFGEVGFDFHKDNSPPQKLKQAHWCEKQLAMAISLHKPVVLHVVRGHDHMLHILRSHPKTCGLVHAFSGGKELAKEYVNLGFVISVGSRFFSTRQGRDLRWLDDIPFVIETDAPLKDWSETDGALIAKRWIAELRALAQRLADGLGVSCEDVLQRCEQNLAKIICRHQA